MIDRYTKAILTVIACALMALVAQNAVNNASAQFSGAPQKVQICDSASCASLLSVFNSKGTGSHGTALLIANEPN